MKKTKENAITLIALIITVIVMLILAGVTVNITIGENGIFKKTQETAIISKKESIKEELELIITDMELDEVKKGSILNKEKMAEKLETIGFVVINQTDTIIEGEYKDYQITINENNKVTIGVELTGVKPTARFELSTTAIGVEELELKVIATTTEGEIESVESVNGLTLVSEHGSAEKTYKVTANGEYRFRIVGTNKRIAVESQKITNILEESESLLEGIANITTSGETKVKVTGKIEEETSTEVYNLNVIYHKGDLKLADTLTSNESEVTIEGLTKNNKTWSLRNK